MIDGVDSRWKSRNGSIRERNKGEWKARRNGETYK